MMMMVVVMMRTARWPPMNSENCVWVLMCWLTFSTSSNCQTDFVFLVVVRAFWQLGYRQFLKVNLSINSSGRMHTTCHYWTMMLFGALVCPLGHCFLWILPVQALSVAGVPHSPQPTAHWSTAPKRIRFHVSVYPLCHPLAVCAVNSYHHQQHQQCVPSLAHFSMLFSSAAAVDNRLQWCRAVELGSEATSFVAKLQKVDIKICAHKLPTDAGAT